jgi:hypothetical protein
VVQTACGAWACPEKCVLHSLPPPLHRVHLGRLGTPVREPDVERGSAREAVGGDAQQAVVEAGHRARKVPGRVALDDASLEDVVLGGADPVALSFPQALQPALSARPSGPLTRDQGSCSSSLVLARARAMRRSLPLWRRR